MLSDRFRPMVMARIATVLRALAAVLLLVGYLADARSLGYVVAAALLFGVVDALFVPAVGALPPTLVGRDVLARLQARRIVALRVGNIVGPALGGLLLTVSAGLSYSLLAGSFCLLLLALTSLRGASVPLAGSGRLTTSVPARLRPLVPLLLGIGLAEIPFSGPFGAAVVMVGEQAQTSRPAAGWLLTCFSLGGLAGGLESSRLTRGPWRPVWVSAHLCTALLLCRFRSPRVR